MSTIGCAIVQYEEHKSFTFQWKGPDPFADIMNDCDNLTLVQIKVEPVQDGTLVTLLHTGWKQSDEWNQAFEWHVQAWRQMLESLKSKLESGEGALCCQ